MVLQRDVGNRIWGNCETSKNVKVTVLENDTVIAESMCKSGDDGEFDVTLPVIKTGGPYDIVIEAGEDNVRIKNVLVGDVFLLTGQSNMELPVSRTLDLTREYSSRIDNDRIRHFEVPKEVDFKGPVSDIYGGVWKKADQESVYAFSALGYFFAEFVNSEQDVPVGLLQTACGGIQIEALIPEEKLLENARILREKAAKRGETREKDCICNVNHSCKFCYEDIIREDKSDEFISRRIKDDEKMNYEFYTWLENNDIGVRNGFKDKTTLFDDGTQPEYINVPNRWEDLDDHSYLEYVRGSVWVLKRFVLPKEYVGRKARLYLGTVIDADETYINGVEVGRTEYRYPPRRYEVPEGILKEENVLVVRVKISQRAGGFVEEMPYYLDLFDFKVSLNGMYEFRIGANRNPEFSKETPELPDMTFFLYRPCGMYNKMIYPLRRLKLKGMLFYQGESNALYHEDYDHLMRIMAESIRECFEDPGLKMAFVELPYFGQEDSERKTDNWNLLRAAQERAKDIPDSVLVDIFDLGFKYELHPQNKKDVAGRVYKEFSKLIY